MGCEARGRFLDQCTNHGLLLVFLDHGQKLLVGNFACAIGIGAGHIFLLSRGGVDVWGVSVIVLAEGHYGWREATTTRGC